MEENKRRAVRLSYILWFILSLLELASLIATLYLIQRAEEQMKLKEAITFYHAGKGVLLFNFVVWFPLITNVFESRNRKSKGTITRSILKVLSFVLILLLSPTYFNIANGGVPRKFEKLYIVQLVHDGETEKAEEIADKNYNFFWYKGESGHEDVFFHDTGLTFVINDGTFSTAYLYSEDDKVDTSTGMTVVVETKPLKNNWYELELQFFS